MGATLSLLFGFMGQYLQLLIRGNFICLLPSIFPCSMLCEALAAIFGKQGKCATLFGGFFWLQLRFIEQLDFSSSTSSSFSAFPFQSPCKIPFAQLVQGPYKQKWCTMFNVFVCCKCAQYRDNRSSFVWKKLRRKKIFIFITLGARKWKFHFLGYWPKQIEGAPYFLWCRSLIWISFCLAWYKCPFGISNRLMSKKNSDPYPIDISTLKLLREKSCTESTSIFTQSLDIRRTTAASFFCNVSIPKSFARTKMFWYVWIEEWLPTIVHFYVRFQYANIIWTHAVSYFWLKVCLVSQPCGNFSYLFCLDVFSPRALASLLLTDWCHKAREKHRSCALPHLCTNLNIPCAFPLCEDLIPDFLRTFLW